MEQGALGRPDRLHDDLLPGIRPRNIKKDFEICCHPQKQDVSISAGGDEASAGKPAATKKSDELLAHAYSKLYDIPCTGLRFFTVYGPAGRPDMAYYSFTEKLCRDEKIQIFNYGNCKRDFTYIDDIVEGIVRVIEGPPSRSVGKDGLPIPPYTIYNIGGGRPENLIDFVHILAEELISAEVLSGDFDIDAHLELIPMQPGDVPVTYADASALEKDYGFKPTIDLRTGLREFARWYREYKGIIRKQYGV